MAERADARAVVWAHRQHVDVVRVTGGAGRVEADQVHTDRGRLVCGLREHDRAVDGAREACHGAVRRRCRGETRQLETA